MKVLSILPYFYPKTGGMENYAYHICKGLMAKYKASITVITSNHEERSVKKETIEGMDIYRLPFWFRVSNTPISLWWYEDIKKIVEQTKPDVIVGHTPVPFISDMGARVAKNLGIPFILTYQNDLVKEQAALNFIIKLYYKVLGYGTFRVAKRIITTTKYFVDHPSELSEFKEKVMVIPPGVYPIKESDKWSVKASMENTVLFVGQLDKTHTHKGVDVLLKAVSHLIKEGKHLQLVCVGKGDNIKNLQVLANDLHIGEHIHFTGFVSDKELDNWYRKAIMVVLPSTSISEGFGMVLLEAALRRKPVIGSDIGGIPYVINDLHSGVLVKPNDPIKLRDAIAEILDDPKKAKSLGDKGHTEVMKNYLWENQVDKTYKLLKSL